MRLLRSVLKKLSIVLFLGYLTLFVVVIINQRALIFHPVPLGSTTPGSYDVPFEVVKIPAGNGQSIYAWWNHYPNPAEHPTVVYCHGNGASLSSYGKVSQIFYKQGWNALFFDYRGYGKSDAPPEGLTEESVAVDADAAYRWAVNRVPEAETFVWGHSLGSSIAARLASKHNPAGLVLEGSFPSMYAMARSRYPFFPILPFMVFDRFATAEYVSNRHFPLLVIHAEKDQIIPLEYGEELYAEAPSPKSWMLLPGINHNDFPSVHDLYDPQIGKIVSDWIASRARGAT